VNENEIDRKSKKKREEKHLLKSDSKNSSKKTHEKLELTNTPEKIKPNQITQQLKNQSYEDFRKSQKE